MHTVDLDMTLDELTKVEGAATLDIRVRGGRVEHVQYKITEFKRFYTKAIEGKPIIAIPQLLSRICGTCSNAHLLCAIEACERALNITPSSQTSMLRKLTMYGLNIRDHALHLYLFAMPDIYEKDSFLAFDEEDKEQHQHLHDGFEIKAAGNMLASLIAGRSVHAMYPTIGGYLKFPDVKGIAEVVEKLEHARPAVLRCIDTFARAPFNFNRKTRYMALVPSDGSYGFLEGEVVDDCGMRIPEEQYRKHLEHVVLPYSQASAYTHKGESYMVGALARMNVARDLLHAETKKSIGKLYNRFPSTDIFDNNLAQAIEILHCLDHTLDLLKGRTIKKEEIIKAKPREAVGIGVIEAPRGTLYHKLELAADGVVKRGEIVVPTGQNQVNIERDIAGRVEELLPETQDKKRIAFEIEKLIRAYDPCMSCAVHFLKVRWNEV